VSYYFVISRAHNIETSSPIIYNILDIMAGRSNWSSDAPVPDGKATDNVYEPKLQAVSTGRSILNRRETVSPHTASAALTPLSRRTCTPNLRSCIINPSKRLNLATALSTATSTTMATEGSEVSRSSSQHPPSSQPGPKRNVSFSHQSVQEYEVTLGDNPSVSSGFPVSLGWRYDPHETIFSLAHAAVERSSLEGEMNTTNNTSDNNGRHQHTPPVRRSMSELKLSDQQRHALLLDDHNVTMENLTEVMTSIMKTKLEREETLNEIRASRQDVEDVICRREKFEETKVEERKMSKMKRRSGIVAGGFVISNQVIQDIVSNAEKTIFL